MNVPLAYFTKFPNFGDALSPWIVSRMGGVTSHYQMSTTPPQRHLLAIGSILQWANEASIVWGTGMISETSYPSGRPRAICAVRGPLTRKRLVERGFNVPKIYGDPALLLPSFYTPTKTRQYTLGIVPHYQDRDHPFVHKCRSAGARVIDVSSGVESFIDQICECDAILSSSLHGLICAEAYGLPTKWIELSDKVIGAGFKFRDYYMSLGIADEQPLVVGEDSSVSKVAAACWIKRSTLDLTPLRNAFPSKLLKGEADVGFLGGLSRWRNVFKAFS